MTKLKSYRLKLKKKPKKHKPEFIKKPIKSGIKLGLGLAALGLGLEALNKTNG